MDISPTAIYNVVIGIVIAAICYLLYRRMKAANPDGEIDVFAYGQLILQAEQTARIIVRGVQEAWRTGELEDDEREDDAIDKLVELYPELDEDDLRRIVKSAVYLLRLGAGKQVDKVMESVPDVPESAFTITQDNGATGILTVQSGRVGLGGVTNTNQLG